MIDGVALPAESPLPTLARLPIEGREIDERRAEMGGTITSSSLSSSIFLTASETDRPRGLISVDEGRDLVDPDFPSCDLLSSFKPESNCSLARSETLKLVLRDSVLLLRRAVWAFFGARVFS